MSKQAYAYEVIRSRIIAGSYGPGYRVVIDAIARELGVSAVPVREALRRLEAEGWITYQRNTGAQVAPVSHEAWEGIVTSIAVLEGYATALAAPAMGDDDIQALRRLNERMEEALVDLDALRFADLNNQFHRLIYSRCDNEYLVALALQSLERADTMISTVFRHVPMRGRASLDEHECLIAAIERDATAEELERLARTHKLNTLMALRSAHARDQERSGGSIVAQMGDD